MIWPTQIQHSFFLFLGPMSRLIFTISWDKTMVNIYLNVNKLFSCCRKLKINTSMEI